MQVLYLLAVIGTRLITVLSALLLSFMLSSHDFGRYTLVNTNALFVQMVFGAWLTSIANKSLAAENTINHEGISSVASGLILAITALILTSLLYALVFAQDGDAFRIISTVLLSILLIAYDTTLAIKNAAGQEAAYTRLALTRNCFAFILSISFVLAGFGFTGAVAGQLLGTILPIALTPSVLRIWATAKPSLRALAALRHHLIFGLAGAATLGIYILVNAPARNIIEHAAGASAAGAWALCSDLFYGPLAVVGNAYALSQVRLLYLASHSGDDREFDRHARDFLEFTLAIAVPYGLGGFFFAPQIAETVLSKAQIGTAISISSAAALQGAALLILYCLSAIALARHRFVFIALIAAAATSGATLAVWAGGTVTEMTLRSAMASWIVVSCCLIWSATSGLARIQLAEIGKLLLACAALAIAATISKHWLAFPNGWILAAPISAAAFIATALRLRLAGFGHALPPSIRSRLVRNPIANADERQRNP